MDDVVAVTTSVRRVERIQIEPTSYRPGDETGDPIVGGVKPERPTRRCHASHGPHLDWHRFDPGVLASGMELLHCVILVGVIDDPSNGARVSTAVPGRSTHEFAGRE